MSFDIDSAERIGKAQLCIGHGGRLVGKPAGFCHQCLLAERAARQPPRAEDYATVGMGSQRWLPPTPKYRDLEFHAAEKREAYKARREAGLCVEYGCKVDPAGMARCHVHTAARGKR